MAGVIGPPPAQVGRIPGELVGKTRDRRRWSATTVARAGQLPPRAVQRRDERQLYIPPVLPHSGMLPSWAPVNGHAQEGDPRADESPLAGRPRGTGQGRGRGYNTRDLSGG